MGRTVLNSATLDSKRRGSSLLPCVFISSRVLKHLATIWRWSRRVSWRRSTDSSLPTQTRSSSPTTRRGARSGEKLSGDGIEFIDLAGRLAIKAREIKKEGNEKLEEFRGDLKRFNIDLDKLMERY